jgi:superfamily II DNA/RNA helicase
MGFDKDIERIVHQIDHKDRQTLLFSATWPKEIQKLAAYYCAIAPIQIKIGQQDAQGNNVDGLTANKMITQNIHIMDNNFEKFE